MTMTDLLPIPEVLKGKEVRELKDIMRVWCPDHNTHPEYMIIETDIYDFYNQPFTPEMLEKYFKGWKRSERHTPVIFNGNIEIDFMFNNRMIIHDINKAGENMFDSKPPKTLNQLISNFSQADVNNLKWRE